MREQQVNRFERVWENSLAASLEHFSREQHGETSMSIISIPAFNFRHSGILAFSNTQGYHSKTWCSYLFWSALLSLDIIFWLSAEFSNTFPLNTLRYMYSLLTWDIWIIGDRLIMGKLQGHCKDIVNPWLLIPIQGWHQLFFSKHFM